MKAAALLLTGLVLSSPALAEDPAAATAQAVRAADAAFAADTLAHGAAAAFRDYMDPTDGMAFTGRGTPTRGAAAIYTAMGGARPDPNALHWAAQQAWGSKGGDMGVTMGVWAITRKGSSAALVTGQYVTVWRKDGQGAWRGLIDIGVPDPRPVPNAALK